ncbi:MAG: hypothetical protein ACAI44_22675 [Candidatus Sericytochromatia bacterium]
MRLRLCLRFCLPLWLILALGSAVPALPVVAAAPAACLSPSLAQDTPVLAHYRDLAKQQLAVPNAPALLEQLSGLNTLAAGLEWARVNQTAVQALPGFSVFEPALRASASCSQSSRLQPLLLEAVSTLNRLQDPARCSLSWSLRQELVGYFSSAFAGLAASAEAPAEIESILFGLHSWLARADLENICSNGCRMASDQAFLSAAEFARLPASGRVDPGRIRFAQDSIRETFKEASEGTVWDLVQALNRGQVKPEAVEPIQIVLRYGRVFTLNHRRLFAFKQARLSIPYHKAVFAPEHLRYFTTDTCGETIMLRKAN